MSTELGLSARQGAALKYKPSTVRLLLVAEAPPSAEDRYFYFEDVATHDGLFRHLARAILGVEPSRENKPEILGALRDHGVYLIDLKQTPKKPHEDLSRFVPDLVDRARELSPAHLITIKANICDLCQEPLRAAGMSVSHARIPFPSSGRQREFEAAMRKELASVELTLP